MRSRACLLALGALTLTLPAIAFAGEPGGGDPTDLGKATEPGSVQVYGGVPASTCQFPMVAAIGNNSTCTATLVHPQVVTTASHCLEFGSPSSVRFGESQFSPAQSVPVNFCKMHPNYPGSSGGTLPAGADDAAFCVLSQPVPIPTTPIPLGCELDELFPGQDRIVVAGYGNNNGGSSPSPSDDTGAGTKRYGASSIFYYDPDNNTIQVGDANASTCQGDSGGPVLLRLEQGTQSWRNVGMLSTGSGDCGGLSAEANYMQTPYFADWLETESGFDLSPCWDDAGNWAPTAECSNFSVDPLDSSVSWSNWCPSKSSGAEHTCGPSFEDGPDTTAPVVSIVTPANQMSFPGPTAMVDIDVDVEEQWPIKSVQLFINGEAIEPLLKAPDYAFSGAMFPEGTYNITAIAMDWSGNAGTSNQVNIGVGVDPEPGGDTGGGGDGGMDGGTDSLGGGTDSFGAGGGGGDGGCAVDPGQRSNPVPVLAVMALLGLGAARRRRSRG